MKVANVDGIRFPNHGEPAIMWAGSIMVYPIALITRTPRKLQPFIVGGIGGMLIQVDLDNLNGQTVYHRFQWTAGGGLRIVRGLDSRRMTTTYLELRVEQLTTWQDAPFQRFRMVAATIALGMRF